MFRKIKRLGQQFISRFFILCGHKGKLRDLAFWTYVWMHIEGTNENSTRTLDDTNSCYRFFLCLKFNSLRQWTSHDFSIRIRSAIPMASACLELRIECHMFEIPNQFLIYSKIMVAIKVTYAYCFGVLSMLNISKLIYLLKNTEY